MLQDFAVAAPPRVFILLPVHNGATYVQDAVDTIIAQTFRDFELLIIDDESTDRAAPSQEGISKRDPRIGFSSRSNKGLISALNELISDSLGELLAKMDQGDVSLPDPFEQQTAFVHAHPSVVRVKGTTMIIDSRGRFLKPLHPPKSDGPIQALALDGHGPMRQTAAMHNQMNMLCNSLVPGVRQ